MSSKVTIKIQKVTITLLEPLNKGLSKNLYKNLKHIQKVILNIQKVILNIQKVILNIQKVTITPLYPLKYRAKTGRKLYKTFKTFKTLSL